VFDTKADVLAHFINRNVLYNKKVIRFVPRLGDELRFSGGQHGAIFKVIKVVWVYDEPNHINTRVNISMERI